MGPIAPSTRVLGGRAPRASERGFLDGAGGAPSHGPREGSLCTSSGWSLLSPCSCPSMPSDARRVFSEPPKRGAAHSIPEGPSYVRPPHRPPSGVAAPRPAPAFVPSVPPAPGLNPTSGGERGLADGPRQPPRQLWLPGAALCHPLCVLPPTPVRGWGSNPQQEDVQAPRGKRVPFLPGARHRWPFLACNCLLSGCPFTFPRDVT